MEAFKQILAGIGGVIGFVTALLTLYASYLDLKKKRAGSVDPPSIAAVAPSSAPPAAAARPEEVNEPPLKVSAPPRASAVTPKVTAATHDRVREMVKAPALALLVVGGLSLMGNLFVAGFAYVDEFVTPLTTQTMARRRAAETLGIADPSGSPALPGVSGLDSERSSTTMGILTILSFAVASAMVVLGAYGMIRLRGYWLSVASSVAVMPAACLCCLGGFPVGVWSLTVLLKPEVASSFR